MTRSYTAATIPATPIDWVNTLTWSTVVLIATAFSCLLMHFVF